MASKNDEDDDNEERRGGTKYALSVLSDESNLFDMIVTAD